MSAGPQNQQAHILDTALQELEYFRVLDHLADRALSVFGREHSLALRPSVDRTWIEQELALTTEMREILEFGDPFPLTALPDVRPALERARLPGGVLETGELVELSKLLGIAGRIRKYLSDRAEQYRHLAQLLLRLDPVGELPRAIEKAIDAATLEVKSSASRKLASLRKSIEKHQAGIRKKLESMVRALSKQAVLQEELITVRGGRLVLMVREEQKGRVPGLIHDRSATGATYFVEPMACVEMNNDLRQVRLEEEQEVRRILAELTDFVREHIDALDTDLAILAELDFIFARGNLSLDLKAAAPKILDEPHVGLKSCRHPLLILREGNRDAVVPLDLALGDETNTLVITGPNAGGKSVALKNVGLAVFMLQSGLHVAAHELSELGIFQGVLTDIGDEQSIENDLSTFSSHVARLKAIVDHAEAGSLVLIDEFGAGTDPDQGASLARAILEALASRECLTIATTHLGALKDFAHAHPRAANGSMIFDQENLAPTYQFQMGLPGASFAFEIAQRFGLKEEIITAARDYTGAHTLRMEDLVSQLQAELTRYRSMAESAATKETKLSGELELVRSRAEDLDRREKRLKKDALKEAKRIVDDANAEVERVIREIREQQAGRDAIRESKQRIARQREHLKEELQKVAEPKPETQPGAKPEPGNWVTWRGQRGVVSLGADKKGRFEVSFGGVKMKVPGPELQVVSPPDRKQARGVVRVSAAGPTSNEIQLLGMRADEAIDELDRFIDQSCLAGLQEIRVVHGKGTGILRDRVNEYLARHPAVEAKRLGNWNEGGTGVTIVQLA